MTLGSLVSTFVVAQSYRHHDRASGLAAEYYAGNSWEGTPVWRGIEAVPHARGLWARAAQLSTPVFSVRWRGYIQAPESAAYRFIARGKPAVLTIDGQRAADGASPAGGPPLRLNRGLHAIQIDYAFAVGPQDFRIAWASGDGPSVPLDRVFLSPEVVPGNVVRQRRFLHVTGRVLPVLLLACLAAACALGLRRAIRRLFPPIPASRRSRIALSVLMSAATAMFAAGCWWGEPAFVEWAPDEVSPNDVLGAAGAGFSGGWATIYPPLHYAVLAAFDAPFYFTAALGLPSIDDVRVRGVMVVVNRLVSAAMAVGILFFVYRLAAEQIRPRAGIAALAMAIAVLPLTYYAKTSNVDVPYHFWLMLALVFYMRALRRHAPFDYYAFTVAAMAAVCTKDQAYGYLVLPASYMVWRAIAHLRNATADGPGLRTLVTMAALAVACLLVFDTVLVNPAGFVEHLRLISGPGSQPFRAYARTLAGHARMAADALRELGSMMSWPVFAASAAAVGWAAWRRERGLLLLLLPAVSYYVTLVSVIGYHYDRFFIGIALILCVFAGWATDRLVPAAGPRRAIMMGAASLVLAYAVGRPVALDALMIRDSRYAAEKWLRATVGPGETVAAAGSPHYLPRHVMVAYDALPPAIAELRARRPDYVVVSAAYARREPDGSAPAEFYQSLRDGREGYTLRAVFRTTIPFSPLALESRFRDVREDTRSNLSKINPVIEVYARTVRTSSTR